MNVRIATCLLLGALPLAAIAAEPAAIEIDCHAPRLPSQQAVADLLGYHNLGQAYAARSRLMLDAQRSCKQLGGARVRIVLDHAERPTTALALQAPR